MDELLADVVTVARRLRAEAGGDGEVPVRVGRIARHHGYALLKSDAVAPHAAASFATSAGATIVVNPGLPRERRRWGIAHEVLEWELEEWVPKRTLRHQASNVGAAEMLIPRDDLRSIGPGMDWNPLELAPRYLVSHEVLVRHLPLAVVCVVSIYDNWRLRHRSGSPGIVYPLKPTRDEAELAMECYSLWQAVEANGFGRHSHCWPVPPNGSVRRVLQVTVAEE